MQFNQVRKKAKRIRHERTLLFIYALAVTAALIISVQNNNNVEASIPENGGISDAAGEDFDSGTLNENLKASEENFHAEPTEILEETEDTVRQIEDIVADNGVRTNQDVVVVAKGDSFIGILTNAGLGYAEAEKLYRAMKKVFDARNLKVGQELKITSTVDGRYNELISIDKVVIEPVSGTRYVVNKNASGEYESVVEQDNLKSTVKSINGTIHGNVSSAMKAAGVPANVVGNFINIFSFSVDFRRDVHGGDQFEISFEQMLSPDGKVVKNGDIIYAALQLGREKIKLYRYKDKSGNTDYYDEKGLALKKTLDRKPMEFKKARVSSRFGRRFHPILKVYRHHDGVDYAAPMGTKVYASGDGVVTTAKWKGGYGNFVSVRHNSEYSTGYGHLKSFAKGIRPGVRVKQGQVIAYVGNTGQSTGPHLHFEVVKNGRKVDPLKIKAATGENLKGSKLSDFKRTVAHIQKQINAERDVAEADTDINQI